MAEFALAFYLTEIIQALIGAFTILFAYLFGRRDPVSIIIIYLGVMFASTLAYKLLFGFVKAAVGAG